eukprot:scaffold6572_cov106-Cylindrotheca_fusiformis.AAC.3
MSSTSEYWVGPTIGEGAFAHVVYAKHKNSSKLVAIKVMDQLTLKQRPEVMQMVLTEQNVLKRLESSNVVRLWASFYDSQCVYLVLELAVGGDLDGMIQHGLSTNSKGAWYSSVPFYCQQIIQAVQYIHSHRILHCDLKPKNILCDGQGGLKLADFGSAMATYTAHAGFVPRGTSAYSCPELLRAESNLTEAVDLWSLGCIFYAMFQNESPFHADTEALTVKLVMEYVDKNDLTSRLDKTHVPHDWKQIVEGLLQVAPGSRARFWTELLPIASAWERPTDFLVTKASWSKQAESSCMRDGSAGWSVFEV